MTARHPLRTSVSIVITILLLILAPLHNAMAQSLSPAQEKRYYYATPHTPKKRVPPSQERSSKHDNASYLMGTLFMAGLAYLMLTGYGMGGGGTPGQNHGMPPHRPDKERPADEPPVDQGLGCPWGYRSLGTCR